MPDHSAFTVTAGQTLKERNVSLLFSGEHDNDEHDAVLPDEEKG